MRNLMVLCSASRKRQGVLLFRPKEFGEDGREDGSLFHILVHPRGNKEITTPPSLSLPQPPSPLCVSSALWDKDDGIKDFQITLRTTGFRL
uniref:Uncharacterized protein n=1 Tax=Vespula pensylvanica TaxID=30213 RepID=A0A834NIF8_VESPE|nr:hypothetical protein H0235_013219 [Vespula pensylvanica]